MVLCLLLENGLDRKRALLSPTWKERKRGGKTLRGGGVFCGGGGGGEKSDLFRIKGGERKVHDVRCDRPERKGGEADVGRA